METENPRHQEDRRAAFLAQHEVLKHRIGVAIVDLSTAKLESVKWQRPLDLKQVDMLAESIHRDGILHPDVNRLSAIWKGPGSPNLSSSTGLKHTILGVFIGQHRAHAVQKVAEDLKDHNQEDFSYEWAVELYRPELETASIVEFAAAITSDNMRRQFKVNQKVLSDKDHISAVLAFATIELAESYVRGLTDLPQTLRRSIQSLLADSSCFYAIQSINKVHPELVRGISGSQGKEFYGWRLGALWGHIASEIILIIQSSNEFRPDGKQLIAHNLPAPSTERSLLHTDGEPWCIKHIPNLCCILNDLAPRIKRTVHLAVGLDQFVCGTELGPMDTPTAPAQVRSALKHLLRGTPPKQFDRYIFQCWMQVERIDLDIQNITLGQLVHSAHKDRNLLNTLWAHPLINSNMRLCALLFEPARSQSGKQMESEKEAPEASVAGIFSAKSIDQLRREDVGDPTLTRMETDASLVQPAVSTVRSNHRGMSMDDILIVHQGTGINVDVHHSDADAIPSSEKEDSTSSDNSEVEPSGTTGHGNPYVKSQQKLVTDKAPSKQNLVGKDAFFGSKWSNPNSRTRSSARVKQEERERAESQKDMSTNQGAPLTGTTTTEKSRKHVLGRASPRVQGGGPLAKSFAVPTWDVVTFNGNLMDKYLDMMKTLFAICPESRRDELLGELTRQACAISNTFAVNLHSPIVGTKRPQADIEVVVDDQTVTCIKCMLQDLHPGELDNIAKLLLSKSVILVVGAGISVCSGLPTFRNERGALKSEFSDAMNYKMFQADTNGCRRLLWQFAKDALRAQVEQRGHMHALVSYLRRKGSGSIISTNVDELEDVPDHLLPKQYQGSSAWTPTTANMDASDNLVRLHGSVCIVKCSSCTTEWTLRPDNVEELINNTRPPCITCSSRDRPVQHFWAPKMRFYDDPHEERSDEAKNGTYRPSKRARVSALIEPSTPTRSVKFAEWQRIEDQDAYQSIFHWLQNSSHMRTVLIIGSSLHNARLYADLRVAGQAGAQIIVVNTVETGRLTSLPNSKFIAGDAEVFGRMVCDRLLKLHQS